MQGELRLDVNAGWQPGGGVGRGGNVGSTAWFCSARLVELPYVREWTVTLERLTDVHGRVLQEILA